MMIDAEKGERDPLVPPTKKTWSRTAPLAVLAASLVLLGVASTTVPEGGFGHLTSDYDGNSQFTSIPGTGFDLGGLFGDAFNIPSIPPVDDVDFDAYTGRWYNVYYNMVTEVFSEPRCATAFYAKLDSEFPAVSVNNSGLCSSASAIGCTGNPSSLDGNIATYILGTASKDDASTDGDLNLRFEDVSRASEYSIIKLGPKTYGAGYYEYSVVGGDSFLFVLARNVTNFKKVYATEVKAYLAESGYTGLFLRPRRNDQKGCPAGDVLYFNSFDPSAPPPVTAGAAEPEPELPNIIQPVSRAA